MKRNVVHSDIAQLAADALIYSTNIRLALTGGVGAALLRAHGIGVQIQLQNASLGTGRQMAEVGEIIASPIKGSLWKQVFHTIATDEFYHTDPEVVRQILRSCLRQCVSSTDLRSVVCSPLGAGYGDLELIAFLKIASAICDEFNGTALQSFTIAVHDPAEYRILCDASVQFPGWNAA
jgi:O-acetyl-ADP-ribose deacetylase (regulator of RNase III)